jgi:hypothetical protein
MLDEAEQVDAAEDEMYGEARGDELPEHLRTKQGRLEAIRKAKAQLEQEAADKAAAAARSKQQHKAERRGEDPDDPEVAERCEQAATEAAARAVPKPTAQRNFTDPESRIMKTSDGSFHQCYNVQAVVDEAHQVIVATELSAQAADAPTYPSCWIPPSRTLGCRPGSSRMRATGRTATTRRCSTRRLTATWPPDGSSTTNRSPPRPRPDPQRCDPETADGQKATHQEGAGRLRAAQGSSPSRCSAR